MKQIDSYIIEKLSLNKDSKYDKCHFEKNDTLYSFNFFKLNKDKWRLNIHVYDIKKVDNESIEFWCGGDGHIYKFNYNIYKNSNGYWEFRDYASYEVFLDKDNVETFVNELIRINDESKNIEWSMNEIRDRILYKTFDKKDFKNIKSHDFDFNGGHYNILKNILK